MRSSGSDRYTKPMLSAESLELRVDLALGLVVGEVECFEGDSGGRLGRPRWGASRDKPEG